MTTVRIPLVISTLAARAAGVVSRLSGRGGGTTLPGRVLNAIDPSASARLARRLGQGSVIISATNGKTTSAAMSAAILAPRYRLAGNPAGANLSSGVATALLHTRGADLGLFEVDEAALPRAAEALQPRALCLGNLFRDQLDRYGELELLAERWRGVVAGLAADSTLIVNEDDPQLAQLARAREGVVRFGIEDARHGGPLPHAADARYCSNCGVAYDYRLAYVGHLGEYSCPGCGFERLKPDIWAEEIELEGLTGSRFQLHLPGGTLAVQLGLPGLYNVYNALAAAALGHALGSRAGEIVSGLESTEAAFGRSERIEIGEKSLLLLLIKNPTGANEVVRTIARGGTPKTLVLALNDGIADGQDVSWIWDVDFEPLLNGLERLVASGGRAAELALRFKYAGFPEGQIEVVPSPAEALDRGLELTAEGAELVVCPTYTAMLELQSELAKRGHADLYWQRAARARAESGLPRSPR
ncbi:MAG: MurT ligase domain-containing protein [Gaiellaceae bacterium]